MREILFRGKSATGEWLYGDLLQYADTAQIWMQTDDGKWNYIVDPKTIYQYTGLTDKNGRKIFEGDIVKHFNDTSIFSNFDVGIILWNKETCGFHRSSRENDGFFLITDSCEYEVIGNIFDNPELLEVGNEID